MDTVKLNARTRTDMSKHRVKVLKHEGFIPATLQDNAVSFPLEIKLRDLVEISRTPTGLRTLLDVDVEGNEEASGVSMIKEVQRDPVHRRVLHVEMQKVSMEQKIVAPVAIEYIGSARGEELGGVLEHVMMEVTVKALPTEIPANISVDVTNWQIGHVARAGEIRLPNGVELVTDSDSVIATLRPPHVHVAEMPIEEEETETGLEEAEEVPAAGTE